LDIRARVTNQLNHHDVQVSTNGVARSLAIPSKDTGFGSSVNGGELLALALATCYCNDLYREAAPLGIAIQSVQVDVSTTFGRVGDPASEVCYHVVIATDAPEATVRRLAEHTDSVAEIHNTLRLGMPVRLESVTLQPAPAASCA
jgi:organic hydroperoxide reductase OsmC/OhrA